MAGMNRGWSISYHMGFWLAFAYRAGVLLGTVLSWFTGVPPLIFTIRRGSTFITQLRIQWLSMLRNPKTPIDPAVAKPREFLEDVTTVQLLGSVDDLVSPDDNIDLATGGGFVYLDVPMSGHADVIEMDDSEVGVGRRKVFADALDTEPAVLKARSLQPADQRIEPDGRVKNVIFVIHGIRDMGYWTQKIARRVIERWREEDRVYDLLLMSSVPRANDIPTKGNHLVIVAAVGDVLNFRIFDREGEKVIDTDEKGLLGQAPRIKDLRKQLEDLWPPSGLSRDEKDRVVSAVRSITQDRRFASITATYGYYTMLPFLLPGRRREKAGG